LLHRAKDKDAGVDPVAGDVASLRLDLLMRRTGYRCGACNPIPPGY
jgi:formate dehydrogenase maturation protein FdhE